MSQGSLESGIGSCIASTIVSRSPPLQNVGSGGDVELKKSGGDVGDIDSNLTNLTLKQIDADDILSNKSSAEYFNKSDWCSASDSEENVVVCKKKKKSKPGQGRKVWCNIKCFFSKSVFRKNHHKKMMN